MTKNDKYFNVFCVSEESIPPNFQEAIANIKRDDKGQKLVVLTQTIHREEEFADYQKCASHQFTS